MFSREFTANFYSEINFKIGQLLLEICFRIQGHCFDLRSPFAWFFWL